MSRIHEALKKAEQERTRMMGETAIEEPREPDISPIPEPLVRGSAPAAVATTEMATPATSVIPHSEVFPSLVDRPSFQSLLPKFQQVEWKPDFEHMLFLSGNNTHAIGAEQFRTLRSRLYQMRQQRPLKKLLIASAVPAEGKSFVAANLAQVIVRQHGRRALLIDGDLRSSQLHASFGGPLSPGLTDYLRGDADEYQILQRGTLENLLFIAGGRPAANPAELINNGRLKTLLQEWEPYFDWIIIDSPPALAVSDASVISDMCDGVLMVVESASTPADMVKKACRECRRTPVLGVVLNRVDAKTNYGGYYYARKTGDGKK